MMTKIATCLVACALLGACTETSTTTTRTTTTAARHQKLADRMLAQQNTNVGEPAPPAEGPEDVPANGNNDPARNPALVPSPLLRTSAASGL